MDYSGSAENKLFPIFLKLEELSTLIVGGGYVGLEKLTAIISNSPAANITLVAPEIRDEIILLSKQFSNIKLVYRKFSEEDLKDISIIIVATNDKIDNENISFSHLTNY